MKTRFLIIIGIIVAITILFLVFTGLFYVLTGIDENPRQVLDVHMEVTGIKPIYGIGEPVTFSVKISSLGTFVPWPDFRIYKDQYSDDEQSEPVFSRLYMTPFDAADRLDNSIQWRERTWDFPLEEDDKESIRFFEDGKYVLRVNAWAKQEQFIEFQVTDSSYVIIPKGAVIEGNEHLIPKEITVVLGKNNTVTWINQDDTGHGIASDKGDEDAWGSPGILKPGDTFSVTFNSTGVYDYHGQPGPWRTGTVIVIEDMDTASLDKLTCENQIHTNKSPEIYNVTPTDDGAIVRWYQIPQTISGEHCGFPEKYKIFVGLDSPISPPFKFTDEVIHGGFRGDYKITGLESNTTYYVDVKGDWGTKVIASDTDMSFTTLSPGEIPPDGNPIEKARDTISGNFTLQK